MRAGVHVIRLGDVGLPLSEAAGPEAGEIRGLWCALRRPREFRCEYLLVPAADAERWCDATERVLHALHVAYAAECEADDLLEPPRGGGWRRIAWRARRPWIRARRDAAVERLRGEMLGAYREFRDRAGDLTERLPAERERHAHERETALAGLDGAVWGCTEYEVRGQVLGAPAAYMRPRFHIFVPVLEDSPYDGATRTGLPPGDVRAALDAARARDPEVQYTWGRGSAEALSEWAGRDSPEEAWRRLTGARLPLPPRRPDRLPWPHGSQESAGGGHGPSSTYGNPGVTDGGAGGTF
ncbi:hypothetical protein [Actinomadura sp. 21ATH]|uniref:hypothetical protein n=1 Tax=Actinomadura sp. 21ATH TaxID=1735444 RepID=UPI0035C2356B